MVEGVLFCGSLTCCDTSCVAAVGIEQHQHRHGAWQALTGHSRHTDAAGPCAVAWVMF